MSFEAARRSSALLLLLLLGSEDGRAGGQRPQSLPADLTQMSLEELANIQVTSAGKKRQRLSEVAAAVTVITQEDIRRSGFTSIAEALRMAPGLDVARIDSEKWAISVRGFNDEFANKLLVLVDGRSVYTPLFSGVYWDVLDTTLEDIDRIEVIRGPGGTLWGANAVNGVINIITKHARDTEGGMLTAGGGSEEEGFGSLRYGGQIGDRAYYRVYSKVFKRNHLLDPAGDPAHDRWSASRGGFRLDWEKSGRDSVMVESDLYRARADEITSIARLRPPYVEDVRRDLDPSGASVLGRWRHTTAGGSEMTFQAYYDHTQRADALLSETRNTGDFDFQHRFTPSNRHDIVWGGGFRYTTDSIASAVMLTFLPPGRGGRLFSGFVQDEITLVTDRLHMAVGSKFEHNDYSGFEIQPSIRLLWAPARHHSAWAAVSRAVRTPSRAETGLLINHSVSPGENGLLTVYSVRGNPQFGAEDLRAYEAGIRLHESRRASLDLATFYNDYANLGVQEPGAPFLESTPVPHLVIPIYYANKMTGETYGVELSGQWSLASFWRLNTNYSWLRMQLHRDSDSRSIGEDLEGKSPRHQVQVRSSWDFPRNFQLDAATYCVSSLRASDLANYVRFDARLGWRPRSQVEISVVGQNLLNDRHMEFRELGLNPSNKLGRSAYGKIVWRF